jgi:hypothetical protein
MSASEQHQASPGLCCGADFAAAMPTHHAAEVPARRLTMRRAQNVRNA